VGLKLLCVREVVTQLTVHAMSVSTIVHAL